MNSTWFLDGFLSKQPENHQDDPSDWRPSDGGQPAVARKARSMDYQFAGASVAASTATTVGCIFCCTSCKRTYSAGIPAIPQRIQKQIR